MPEIEFIPWTHLIQLDAHKQVLEYVKTLPKNSIMLIEMSQYDLDTLEKYIKTRNLLTVIWEPYHSSAKSAGLELILECLKKNITLIPIEDSPLRTKITNLLKKTKSPSKIMEIVQDYNDARENIMVNRILETIKQHPNKSLFVLTGAGHIENLAGEIRAKSNYFIKIKKKFDNIDFRKDTIAPFTNLKRQLKERQEKQKQRIQKNLQERLKRKLK